MNGLPPARVVAGVSIPLALALLWVGLGTSLFTGLFVSGLYLGAIYALSGLGLVITYRASGVFNFGHGAIAMLVAYVLWQLVEWGLPVGLGALVAVGLIGPGIGVLLERLVFRPLDRRDAGTAEQLVATVGVFILLVGVAIAVWGAETKTDPPSLFSTRGLRLPGGIGVSVDQLGIVAVVGAVTVGIWWLFERTRAGLRIRAVVERRELAQLSAVDADRVSAIGWALGAGLAGLTGVLLAPSTFGLSPYHFTLLVAETFAVAVIARLESLSLSVVGGIVLGLAVSFGTQLRADELLTGIGIPAGLATDLGEWVRPILASLPVVALFLALFVHRRFAGAGGERGLGPAGRARRTLDQRAAGWAYTTGVVALLLLVPFVLDEAAMRPVHDMLALAVVFVSITVITGYGGHITLGQAAFAGVGAFLTGRLVAGTVVGLPALPVLPAMLIAAVLCMLLGVAVGFPALRRHGVLLGLTTFATGLVLERFVFANYQLTAGTDTIVVQRPSLFGLDLSSSTAFHFFELGVLALVLLLAVALRTGRMGRTLRAMRDAPAAAEAIGIRPRRYTLLLFVVGTGLAGLGGSLLAQSAQTFSSETFRTFDSLIWFAAVLVAGVTSLHGALLAAFALTVLERLAGDTGLVTALVGLGALSLGYLPGGVVGWVRTMAAPPAASSEDHGHIPRFNDHARSRLSPGSEVRA